MSETRVRRQYGPGAPRVRSGVGSHPLARCNHCGDVKPCSMFYGSQGHCKGCNGKRSARWRAENLSRSRAYNQEGHLRRRFGLTAADYDAMLALQAGGCAICSRPPECTPRGEAQRLVVDHNHATGEVRGLLCRGCNVSLGQMGDSPTRLRAAATYLETRP